MNNRPILFLLIVVGSACTYNNVNEPQKKGFNPVQDPEKWQLIQMTGNLANVPPATGSNMNWQEWYMLFPDHSFTKTRVRDNVTSSANGSYAVVTLSDGQYLAFGYPSKNDLIGNCTGDTKELLKVNSENELAGTWSACDGPGLLYQKVK